MLLVWSLLTMGNVGSIYFNLLLLSVKAFIKVDDPTLLRNKERFHKYLTMS